MLITGKHVNKTISLNQITDEFLQISGVELGCRRTRESLLLETEKATYPMYHTSARPFKLQRVSTSV